MLKKALDLKVLYKNKLDMLTWIVAAAATLFLDVVGNLNCRNLMTMTSQLFCHTLVFHITYVDAYFLGIRIVCWSRVHSAVCSLSHTNDQ